MELREPCYPVFEVFIQRSPLEHHVHVGSLVAPSSEVALMMARENFLRRDKAVNLWIVPQEEIVTCAAETDFLARESDKQYREVAGYTENGRLWRLFKEKAMTLEEIVAYVEGRKNISD